jgi:hypothetical protein
MTTFCWIAVMLNFCKTPQILTELDKIIPGTFSFLKNDSTIIVKQKKKIIATETKLKQYNFYYFSEKLEEKKERKRASQPRQSPVQLSYSCLQPQRRAPRFHPHRILTERFHQEPRATIHTALLLSSDADDGGGGCGMGAWPIGVHLVIVLAVHLQGKGSVNRCVEGRFLACLGPADWLSIRCAGGGCVDGRAGFFRAQPCCVLRAPGPSTAAARSVLC